MEEKDPKGYIFAYEIALDRMHRIIKWLIIVVVILIISLVGTNVAWVLYENQFVEYEETITQESDTGTNNYIGDDGFIVNN